MPIHRIDHYNLRATAEVIERLKDFYQIVLGLEVGARPAFASTGYWLYADGAPIVHLSVMHEGENHPTHTANTLDHIAFTCSGIGALMATLDAQGIPYNVDRVPGLGYRQVFFTDPAGNGIELSFAPES